jgi:hypothetical protein
MAYPESHYTVTGRGPSYPNAATTAGTLILAKDSLGNLAYVSASQLQTTLDGAGLATDADIAALSASISTIFDGSGDGVFNTVQANINGTGTNFKVGDDVYIGDMNVTNTMVVSGQGSRTVGYIQFGSGSNMPTIGGGGENHLNIDNIPAYASNAAALSGGLSYGDIYRNGDNLCIAHA